jgi:hypothetical protein
MEKICTKCNIKHPLENFPKRKNRRDGRGSWCNICMKKTHNDWKEDNQNWYEEWKVKNPTYHIDRYNGFTQEQHQEFHSKVNQYHKNNPQKINQYQKKQRQKPKNKIVEHLRHRMRVFVFENYSKEKYEKILGCNVDEYKKYLENLFDDKMSWENYGKGKYWEIDHIKPISLFDEKDIENAFHYTNTKPSPITENRKKGNRFIG